MSPREADNLYLNSQPSSCESLAEVAKPVEDDADEVQRETKIRFGSVIVREYNQVMGDHPEVKVGPPISLGWLYEERAALPLDDYEESRPKKRLMKLTSITRKNLLLNVYGYSEEEIKSTEKEIQKIRRKREQSTHQGKAGRKIETAMQAARRRLRRTFSKDSFVQGFSAASGMMPPFAISANA